MLEVYEALAVTVAERCTSWDEFFNDLLSLGYLMW